MKKYISILFLFMSVFTTALATGNPVTLSCFCSEVIEDPYACPSCPKEVVFTGLGITDDVTGDIKYVASDVNFQWKENLFGSWVYINGVKYDSEDVTIIDAPATLDAISELDACIRGKAPVEIPPVPTIVNTDGSVEIIEGVNAEGGIEYQVSAVPSTVSSVSNGDGTTTVTHTNSLGETFEFCVQDKDLDPVFAVNFVEPANYESCSGTFDLNEGGDTKCSAGQTLFSLTSIPDGYVATVDAVSGEVTFWLEDAICGVCECEASILEFGYDLISDCGTVSATHTVTIVPPPTGEVFANKNQEWVEPEQGQIPSQIIVTLCAGNQPDSDGDLVEFEMIDELDPSCYTNPIVFPANPSITISGNTVTFEQTGIVIAPGDQVCGTYVVDAVAGKSSYPNVASVTAVDESGNDSQHSAADVLSAVPLAESRVLVGAPNNNGEYTTIFSDTKTDGSAVTTCEKRVVTYELIEDGVTSYSVLEGTTCDDLENFTVVSGYDMTQHYTGNTLDKYGWSLLTGYHKASEGESILNGNQYITQTTDIEGRTFAQTVRISSVIGGDSETCPIASTNEDNFSDYCKYRANYIAGITPGYNGTNVQVLSRYVNANNGFQHDDPQNYGTFTSTCDVHDDLVETYGTTGTGGVVDNTNYEYVNNTTDPNNCTYTVIKQNGLKAATNVISVFGGSATNGVISMGENRPITIGAANNCDQSHSRHSFIQRAFSNFSDYTVNYNTYEVTGPRGDVVASGNLPNPGNGAPSSLNVTLELTNVGIYDGYNTMSITVNSGPYARAEPYIIEYWYQIESNFDF